MSVKEEKLNQMNNEGIHYSGEDENLRKIGRENAVKVV